jgi:hypothetical protein
VRSAVKSFGHKPTNGAAKGLPAQYAIPRCDSDGAVPAWIELAGPPRRFLAQADKDRTGREAACTGPGGMPERRVPHGKSV